MTPNYRDIDNIKTYKPVIGTLNFHWNEILKRIKPGMQVVLVHNGIYARANKRADWGCLFVTNPDGILFGLHESSTPWEITPEQFHAEVFPVSIASINYTNPTLKLKSNEPFVPIGQQSDGEISLTA